MSAVELSKLRDVVNLLYSNAYSGLAMTTIAISAIVFGFPTPNDSLKHTFWGVMMTAIALRLGDALYWQKRIRNEAFHPVAPLARFSFGVLITAFTWASYGVALYHKMTILELASTMIVLAAMAGGAATVLAASRILVWTYCSFLLLPMSFMAAVDSRQELVVIGFLGFIFWLVMLITSLKSNSFFLHTIDLKAMNVSLVSQMEAERNAVARINQELQQSNKKLDATNANLEVEVERRTGDIYRLSNLDPLTALMNRTGFIRQLDQLLNTAMQLNKQVALLFIDLDGFKQVNDSLGHQVGDEVLVEVATRLRRFSNEEYLARWGGDEFIVVIPYANADTARTVAHSIRNAIARPIYIQQNHILLDATTGVALFPDHASDGRTLIQEADLTMFHEKRISRGRVGFFNCAIYASLQEEQRLKNGLREAIKNKELYVVYQPIVHVATGKVWAFEALLRWRFQDTIISPATFIPIAEKSGVIHELGIWVLHRACLDALNWPQGTGVSVNVSVVQLMDDGFLRRLKKALTTTGIPPTLLHLEVTESIFADNKERLTEQVNAIKALNVAVSIDDFGTGFSSLSQLQILSFDHIKIDRSFVEAIETTGGPIIRATLLIAGEFGYTTIAEGVETQKQADRLKAMGVDCIQGFYYAKPQRVDDLKIWFNNEN